MAFVAYSDAKILFKGHTKCAQSSLFVLLGQPWNTDQPGILGKMDLTTTLRLRKRVKAVSPDDERAPMSYWKQVWLKYRTATFVRNPYDRVVSGFFYGKQYKSFPENYTFEQYVLQHAELKEKFGYIWLPKLTDFIDCPVDFVGRYETLHEDVERFCIWAGVTPKPLPHINKSAKRIEEGKKIPWQEMYNDDMLRHVAEWYKKDFEMFDY